MNMRILILISFSFLLTTCGIYTPYGAQTSGAKTFSVDYIKPQTPLASPAIAQNFTEALKDLIQRQSTLRLEDDKGELQFKGMITEYRVSPVGVSGDEIASRNRLTVSVKINYVNTLETDLNFDRTFTKFSDYDSGSNLLDVEDELMADISEQLTQEIFNASLGNW
ncbi:MAG: LptE family protein [Flavobacteriales bacterium]|nr:LptE family protein [Flavobacteriales bacterium]MDG2245193.1 LptE family protein [Flavobacteriales bacterium]